MAVEKVQTKGIQNIFDRVGAENFPTLETEMVIQLRLL
jgi:shikimate kinase